ncbi:lipopolysaccharide biosynthesis protein [Methylobacterium mesophilicum]
MKLNRALLAAGWTISSRTVARIIDFTTLLVLARTLNPADFGLVAMAMIPITITEVICELPLFQALIRLESIKRSHLNTAFTLSLLRGLVIALTILLIASPFSVSYGDARLLPLVCILCLAPIARGLGSPRMVVFYRNLSFRQGFTVEISGKVLAATLSMFLVIYWPSYWIIAVNTIASPLAMAIISYVIAPYKPSISLVAWADFRGFVGWISLVQVISSINWQYDRLVLGHFTNAETVGRYVMANDIAALPVQSIIAPAMRPTMAAFAGIANDSLRLSAAYLRVLSLIAFVGMPLVVGLSITANTTVEVVLGGKWIFSVEILRWLALDAISGLLVQPFAALMMALNRPKVLFYISLVELSIKLPIVFIFANEYGLFGIVGARIGVASFVMIFSLIATSVILNIRIIKILDALWRPIVSSLVMAAVINAFKHWLEAENYGLYYNFFGLIFVGGITYIGTIYLLGFKIRDYRIIKGA